MKITDRIYQRAMTASTGLMCREPEVISGRDAMDAVVADIYCNGIRNIMLATTAGTLKRGTLDKFMAELERVGIAVTLFTDIEPDPTVESATDMAEAYCDGGCGCFVAVGGGSVIDCAKAASALIARPSKTIRKLKGVMKVRHKTPLFYAVPTTAGTGSEATAAAVITDTVDDVHYKFAISDPALIPDVAVLDPGMTLSLPQQMTAWTGMDALTHAVEAFTNKFPARKVQDLARESVHLIFENLPAAYADGQNYEARDNMLTASFYAGIAFTNNFVGYVHAVAHAVGAIYGIPHGKANAIILPHVLELFGSAINTQLAKLAYDAGLLFDDDLDDVPDLNDYKSYDAYAARKFIRAIRDMNESMGIPEVIEELRIDDFDEIIARAMKEANPTYPVPVIWGEAEFGKLLGRLLKR